MAAIIFSAIGIGAYVSYIPPGTGPRPALLDFHKSLGMTALILVAVRSVYRLIRGEPSYQEPPAFLPHIAAKLAHFGLYALMLFMPVTGYLFSGAGGYSLPWFGLFSWPRLVAHDMAVAAFGQQLHHIGAWVIGGLLLAHILAVIWHRWIKKDEVLARMLP
jgi:cytochrome b561